MLGTDVPLTFEPLDVGPIIPGEARPPGYLRTKTVRRLEWTLVVQLPLLGALAHTYFGWVTIQTDRSC